MSKKHYVIAISSVIAGTLIFSQIFSVHWYQKVLFKSCQPEQINYDSWGPYCLTVVKQKKTIGSDYFLRVTIEEYVDTMWGVQFAINYIGKPGLLEGYNFQNVGVTWASNGVYYKIFEDSGVNYELFITKDHFIGGR